MKDQFYYAAILLAIRVEMRKQFAQKNIQEIKRLQKIFWDTKKSLQYSISLAQAEYEAAKQFDIVSSSSINNNKPSSNQ